MADIQTLSLLAIGARAGRCLFFRVIQNTKAIDKAFKVKGMVLK